MNNDNHLFDSEEHTREEIKSITREMEDKYLSYAMSVIVTRALPDVRDGLKPVHRRILYAMNELNLKHNSKFKKSAAVVGEVLGKYHPHGDSAVYDSMVRLAQDFATRYQLVNGQGNFGSIDGDSAAAMRYTEAKMHQITEFMMNDIDKDTVNFRPNYDGEHQEPSVLPTQVPNLLLNGTIGIAVAMATSIPPHNLNELCQALRHLVLNEDATIEDLLQFISGPDFPTGGIIYDTNDIKQMYTTGRGGIVVRAKTEIIDLPKGKSAIIVNEIPYLVNKANLVTKIAELVRDKKITEITDLRDESNKDGIRVVIELKKDSYPNKVLQQLFKMTQLQTSFNMNLIALVDGIQPRLLNLKQVLAHFLKHRKEVIRRRTEFDLKKAKDRAHILEGLKIALNNIDDVIATIKASSDRNEACENLINKFTLTEIQAKAILDMRLQTLAGLERQKIEDEYKQIMELIADLEDILAKPERIIAIIVDELTNLEEKFGDERRTEVVPTGVSKITTMDTVPNAPMVVTMTNSNYIKRMEPETFRVQNRGGKGKIGISTKENDYVKLIEYANNHDRVMFFTDRGRVFNLRVFEIPQGSRNSKGQAIVNILDLQKGENITSVMVLKPEDENAKYLMMSTKLGFIKKVDISDFEKVRRTGMIAIKLRDGDRLDWVDAIGDEFSVQIVTKHGKSIRFMESDVRCQGRVASGVTGIKLKKDDEVIAMVTSKSDEDKLLVLMENGLGKSTPLKSYRVQKRGGTGIKAANVTSKTGNVVGAVILKDVEGDILMMSKNGVTLRLSVNAIPNQGRSTQGVYLMRLSEGDSVVTLSFIPIKEDKTEVDEQTPSLLEVES